MTSHKGVVDNKKDDRGKVNNCNSKLSIIPIYYGDYGAGLRLEGVKKC